MTVNTAGLPTSTIMSPWITVIVIYITVLGADPRNSASLKRVRG